MAKERRLGRGLEALLALPNEDGGDMQIATAPLESARVSVFEIDPNPYQPRQDFDQAEIDSLAESIREHGLIQPIVVRRLGERYQLVAGDRRLRASIKAGLSDVPVHLLELDDRRLAELAIVENLQRKDLNAIEKAASFQSYLKKFGCTQEDLAGRLQLDRSTVANLIRLLELPDEVQQAVRRGEVTPGHARALLPLEEREQINFCRRIQAEQLSVRSVESLVNTAIHEANEGDATASPKATAAAKRTRTRTPHRASLEQELRSALGAKVDIISNARGRGRIVIHFGGHEEFERLFAQLRGGEGTQRQAG
ncbi:MAG: ParB/RepB/Spo0J family partition protein [Planctomycetia bacterium]|nr:ParB/RepB/Spo0J family partition protein [Planctomycetia bacterium]